MSEAPRFQFAPANPEQELEGLHAMFKALADPARLRIVNLLAHGGELCNCHIEAITGYGNSKISRHLRHLKLARLVRDRRDGVWLYYSLAPPRDELHEQMLSMVGGMHRHYPVLEQDVERLRQQRCSISKDMRC